MLTRRTVLGLSAALAMMSAACGSSDGVSEPSATSATTTTIVRSTSPATSSPANTTAPQTSGDEPPTTTTTPPPYPRTVTDVDGDVEIPSRPERIIATGSQVDLDSLLVLDIAPVAAGTFFGEPPSWVGDALDGAVLFDVNDTNLEQVAGLAPDLIIGPADVLEPLADPLRQIAPTLLIDTAAPWRENLDLIARATGREERAAAFLATLDDTVDEALIDNELYRDLEVSGVTVGPDGGVLVLAGRSALGEALRLVGVPRVAGQDADAEFIPVSEELLGELDGDVIVVWHSPFLEAQWQDLSASPVWQSLPAVAEGRVVVTTDAQWFFATPESVRLAVAGVADLLATALDDAS
ncbi:MAG: ABC transporter substrate-binding protein [Actinomycetota bacterium]